MNLEAKIVYLAGLIDGEGYIGIRRSNRTCQPSVKIDMTHEGVIRWIIKNFGGKYGCVQPPANREIAHRWTLSNRRQIRNLLQAIQPFTIVKQLQIAIVLDFYKKFWDESSINPKRRYSDSELSEMDLYFRVMTVANSTGPGSGETKVKLFNAITSGDT
jgi:hypothetical protein